MNICVIGGDLRTAELIKMLAKDENDSNVIKYANNKNSANNSEVQVNKNQLFLYGLEKCDTLTNSKGETNFNHIDNLEKGLQNCDFVITSIPLSKDGKYINANFTDKKISVQDFFNTVKNKKIITGNITNEIQSLIKPENNNEIIDVLKYEELTILNSIPTAEGAIQIAMEKSQITLHNSNCLVLGFGRIGKILAKMLQGFGANVYCEARKPHDIAWIKAYGYNPIMLDDLNENLSKFDFIFNTIPYVILDKNNLNLIQKECIIIDLASKPGGVDFDEANRLGLKTDWALALPGKVAPKTSAKYIYDIIKKLEIK